MRRSIGRPTTRHGAAAGPAPAPPPRPTRRRGWRRSPGAGARRAGPLAARARTAPLADVAQRARDYAQEAKAANTRRAYRADWRDFTAWCEGHGRTALPAAPETVALYLTDLAGRRKTSTLQRRLSSISQAHQLAGHAAHDSPTRHATVRAVWAGIRRAKGTAQAGKAPALTADVRAMVATLPDTLLGLRDRALLLLGFAGAFRRSELVGLDVGDLEAGRAGLAVTLRRSKTDQEGAGRKLGVPYGAHPDTCPVRAVQEWLDASRTARGPALPQRQPARAGAAGAPLGQGRGPGGQAGGGRGGARPGALRRPQPARRPGHRRGHGGGQRAQHHGPDRAPQRADGAHVHPRRPALPRQRRGGGRSVGERAHPFVRVLRGASCAVRQDEHLVRSRMLSSLADGAFLWSRRRWRRSRRSRRWERALGLVTRLVTDRGAPDRRPWQPPEDGAPPAAATAGAGRAGRCTP